jgi:N-acetylmuramoyl-L-alanine amidase
MMRIIERPSPNHDERGKPIDILVMHYTGMKTCEEAVARLTDAEARVSSHYTVDEDGTVYAHVPEARRAWHAGVSYWAGETNVNARSVGIEIVNPGHEFGYREFPEAQIRAVIELSHGIMKRHPIPASRVVGHSDVAPARKTDPGELFPWRRLAEEGIGVWPEMSGLPLTQPSPQREEGFQARGNEAALAESLRLIGYGVPPDVETPLEIVVKAFQRRFRPRSIDGVADGETCAVAEAVWHQISKFRSR